MNTPHHLKRPFKKTVIVSIATSDGAAISTDVDQYVRLDEEAWRWIIEEVGPRVLDDIRRARVVEAELSQPFEEPGDY